MSFPVTERDHSTFIPRPSEAASSPMERLSGSWFFALSAAVFIVSAVACGGAFAYRKYLESQRATLTALVKEREQALQSDSLREVIAFSQSLNAAQTLLAEHPFPSNVFRFLQENTHPAVQFKSFSFAGQNRRIDMNAVARSYRAVAEQVSALEGNPDVEQVDFGGLSSSGAGLVNFRVSIILGPSVFQYRSP
ncbi:MAG: hypothetical protein A3B37_03855 [Candidatus Sungbacteria bacterium RIFCSPLOWO2_01_FULL_59_16]|uniref:PilN domain-containing protein n=1 Tax=Candidatus Sungbacteria bacterium RIFCSPLOWO2_01_FULL_59_16 TaxID=1802280 RepID=A0A1G2L943_9BACT|nr:MAG: hypothetical protein A3B37_03855 [Candidatus Sungbacteria bacterium RIFCSPLOWO2_01_FULL_59_16]